MEKGFTYPEGTAYTLALWKLADTYRTIKLVNVEVKSRKFEVTFLASH